MGSAFRRARQYLGVRPGATFLAHAAGGLAGALYVAWMVLLVLFVELMQDGATFRPEGSAAEYARTIEPIHAPPLGPVVYSNSGMLSAVVGSRDHVYGPLLATIYHRVPAVRRSLSYLLVLIGATLAVGLLRGALLYVQAMAAARAIADARTRIQRDLFHHRFAMGSAAFAPGDPFAMTPLLREEVGIIQVGLEHWLDILARESAKIAFLLALVLTLNWYLGLTFILLTALIWIVGAGGLQRILKRRRMLAEDAEAQLRRVVSMGDTLRLIKGYAADNYFRERIEEHLSHFHQDVLRRLRYEARLRPYWQSVGVVLALVIMALGAQNVLTEKFAVAAAVGVFAALISLGPPLYRLYQCQVAVRRAGRSADRVFAFLDQPAGKEPADGTAFLQPLRECIELEKVTYKDIHEHPLVDNWSIRIHAGQRIALVGKSDAEKHAFAYLLSRFIDPQRGEIRFDGVDTRTVTLDSLRSQVCLVLQSDLLFPDTVANNIGLGDPGFSLQRITDAAKVAHAHQFIQRLPHGYDCLIGAEGFPLKVGESYRVALARAILRDPPVVVIEEPKEPLDEDTKAALDDTIWRFFPGRTVILLPHRLSTIRACDQVFLIDQGKLVSCGSHRELLETSELYRHLQYTEFQQPQSFAS